MRPPPRLPLASLLDWLIRRRSETVLVNRYDISFSNLTGGEEAIDYLEPAMAFLQQPSPAFKSATFVPQKILLIGPAGIGKSLVARAAAGQAGVPLVELQAETWKRLPPVERAGQLNLLFKQAQQIAPSIIFIEDLNQIHQLGRLDVATWWIGRQLRAGLDGLGPHIRVVMLAGTHRPDELVPELLQPGRFEYVPVGLPDRDTRQRLLYLCARRYTFDSPKNLETLSRVTVGFQGNELIRLCEIASAHAQAAGHITIRLRDLEAALDVILRSGARESLFEGPARQAAAYVQAGRAVASWCTPGIQPVPLVSILPGTPAVLVTGEPVTVGKIDVMLAGEMAQKLEMENSHSGTSTGHTLIRRLTQELLLERSQTSTEADLENLLQERSQMVRQLLLHQRKPLRQLAEKLVQDETVDKKTLLSLLGNPIL